METTTTSKPLNGTPVPAILEPPKVEYKEIPLTHISIGKTNPRVFFDEESIQELAQSIEIEGVIHPVLVRPYGKEGHFQLVCGERRLKACHIVQKKIAARNTIPATIRQLSDELAMELQITENLMRKDVHPMEEAAGFKALMDRKKYGPYELAGRLGRSVTYIAIRVKLMDLIPEFQKAFFKDRMKIALAIKVCKLAAPDQKELWKEQDEKGEITISKHDFQKYQADLNNAPFDTHDPNLKKDMGACDKCQFNSASSSLLFPEQAHRAICMHAQCFKSKCDMFYNRELTKALNDPTLLLVTSDYNAGKMAKRFEAQGHVIYGPNQFEDVDYPEAPDFEEFEEDLGDGVYEDKEEMEKEYNDAIKDFEKDLIEYNKKVNSGRYKKAFVIEGDDKGKYIYLTLKKNATSSKSSPTSQSSPQTQAVTEVDIKGEIERLQDRETRSKELDWEKITPQVFDSLREHKPFAENSSELVRAETIALIVILVETAGWTAKEKIYKALKLGRKDDYTFTGIYKELSLIKSIPILQKIFHTVARMVILDKLAPPQGTRPETSGKAGAMIEVATHYFPKAVATITAAQMDIRDKREARVNERIKELKTQLKKPSK